MSKVMTSTRFQIRDTLIYSILRVTRPWCALIALTGFGMISSQVAAVGFSGHNANPQCFALKGPVNETSVLRENGIHIKSPLDSSRTRMIAGAANRIRYLLGNKAGALNNVSITIHKNRGTKKNGSPNCASFTSSGSSIELVANCFQGDSPINTTTHFVHEMGHITGLRNGNYAAYQKSFGGSPCKVTEYCTENHNDSPFHEEFAEVFASFVGSPNRLKSMCPQQYEWMKNNVFGGADPTTSCTGLPGPVNNSNMRDDWSDENSATDSDSTSLYNGSTSGQSGGIGDILSMAISNLSQQNDNERAPAATATPATQPATAIREVPGSAWAPGTNENVNQSGGN